MAATQAAGGFSMDRLSFPICSVAGVPIRVHFMLPLVAGMAAMQAGLGGLGAVAVVFALLVNGPLLLATVWVHEMGHITAARRCGFMPDHILLWPLGGLAYISKDGITPKEQIFVSVSGPLTHLPMLGLWALLLYFTSGQVSLSTYGMWYSTHFVQLMCVMMLINNIAMLIFNLLVPCIPLDCSQILVSVLLLCGADPSTAAGVMVCVSVPVVLLLTGYAVYTFIAGAPMAGLSLMMALWLGYQTYRLHQARKEGALGSMPLFASAMAMKTDGGAAAAPRAPASSPGRFKAFEGQGHTLGKATSNEVCISSLVAVALNMLVMMQLSANAP